MAHDHFVRYELYPPAPPHHAHPHPHPMRHHHLLPPDHHQGAGVAAGYEVTAGGAEAGGGGPPQTLSLPHQVHGPQDYRKRKSLSYHGGSEDEDDTGDDARSSRTAPDKKQNHSEIEKRRRDKMNMYIVELSALVPMCGAMARKLDKLTVLRMAVQHLRAVRGTLSACPLNARPRPSFLHERELNQLVLNAAAASCFVLVLSCDRARLLYVSASVQNLLLYEQGELLGQTFFDILHPKDVAKVKEQLSSSDLSPRERLIDAKTMLPVKTEIGGVGAIGAGTSRFCPGARRSFFCRIKCKGAAGTDCAIKEELDSPSTKRRKPPPAERKYAVVQVTGYLKSWSSADAGDGPGSAGEEGAASEEETCNMSCLVAVCRTLSDMRPSTSVRPTVSDETRQLYFISRHATDGKFLFVDQRVTPALGFLPQEMLSTSVYEYVSNSDLRVVAKAHKAALIRQVPHITHPYSFRRKDGSYAVIQTHFKPFRNPWTKDVESLLAKNILVLEQLRQPQMAAHTFDLFGHEDDMEMQRLINSQMELKAIGAAIAEEALRREQSPEGSGSPQPPPAPRLPYSAQAQACAMAEAEGQTGGGAESLAQYPPEMQGAGCAGSGLVRNNVSLAAAAGPGAGTPICAASPPLPPLSHDGNDEAAMAVIMSLLEADAGLGGPVDFSSLPWPLP